jgi:prepilin peptidase CpaA
MQLSYPPPAIVAALLMVVITASVFDVRSRRIPNWVSVAGALMGIGLNAFGGRRPAPGRPEACCSASASTSCSTFRAMGAGDVKLMGAVGSLVGPQNWFGIFIFTAILGGMMALILVVARTPEEDAVQHRLHSSRDSADVPPTSNGKFRREEPESRRLAQGAVIAVGCVFAISAHFTR